MSVLLIHFMLSKQYRTFQQTSGVEVYSSVKRKYLSKVEVP